MTNDPFNIEKHNKAVRRSGFRIRSLLKGSISRLSMKGKRQLIRSLRLQFKKDYGEIDNLKFEFSRHGVFFHKGVGRGYVMQGGRVIRGTKKDSIFKAIDSTKSGPMKRRPKDWFNPVLDREVPKLANIVASLQADGAAEKLINIK